MNVTLCNNLTINELISICHRLAKDSGWWSDLRTGEPITRNTGEIMMLFVSEISEAFEGARKNTMDEHLPHRKSIEVELADALIRIFDFAGHNKLDLEGALLEKLEYNKHRLDHQISERKKPNGKKF